MPTTEHPKGTRPPICELPDEIASGIMQVVSQAIIAGMVAARDADDTSAENASAAAINDLRATIRAALDERDAALRERAERLRVANTKARERFRHRENIPMGIGEAMMSDLHWGVNESDYADDLIPRKGDVLT